MTAPAPSASRAELNYATAFLGAHLAFIPLFALLLPRRVTAVDPDHALTLLSMLLLAGGITASLANIAAGRWSDRWITRHGNRRGLIAIGVVALLAAQLLLAWAVTAPLLFAAIIALQLALNLMFAPLGALLADHIPDNRKGRVAGWLNASLPLASLGTGLAALLFPNDGAGGFVLIAALSAAAVLPLVVWFPFAKRLAGGPTETVVPAAPDPRARADYFFIWGARLLIQLGAAFMISYFFLYLTYRGPAADASRRIGQLALLSTILSFASAVGAGYWSDRIGRRKPPMMVAGMACACGLFLLALEPPWSILVAAFTLFHLGLTAFLSVDSAMVTQLLSTSDRRGELLGFMNLTNTLPSIIVPIVALTSLGRSAVPHWPLGFAIASLFALAALGLLSRVRTVR